MTVDTLRRGLRHLQRRVSSPARPAVVTAMHQTPFTSCALSAGFCVSESLGRCNERSELGKAGRRHSFCLLPPSCPGTCLHALVKRPGHHPILSFYIAHALIKVLDAFPTYISFDNVCNIVAASVVYQLSKVWVGGLCVGGGAWVVCATSVIRFVATLPCLPALLQ